MFVNWNDKFTFFTEFLMSKKHSFIFLLFLLVVISPSARAQEAKSHVHVRVETDSHKEEFQFYIGEKLIAILDKNGLRVAGDISYAGDLTNLVDPKNVMPDAEHKQEADDETK